MNNSTKITIALLSSYHDYLKLEQSNNNKFKYSLYRVTTFILKYTGKFFAFFLSQPKTKDIDILFLSTSKTNKQELSPLWQYITKNSSYKIIVETQSKWKHILKGLPYYNSIDSNIPANIFYLAAYSKYITTHFSAKLYCLANHFDVIPSFIKKYINKDSKTIHIPHGMQPNHFLYTTYDFDFYFVFGDSSITNINNMNLRLGNTEVVKTGSTKIKKENTLDPITPNNKILLFSDWWPEKYPKERAFFEIISNWIKENKKFELYIKLHPKEKGDLIKSYFKNCNNVTILPKSTSIKEALKNTYITLTSWSVASVEAALMNRPSISVNFRQYNKHSNDYIISDKYLLLEHFFLRRATNKDELSDRIEEISKNYPFYVKQCQKYADYHLSNTTNSFDKILSVINNIYLGKKEFNTISISQNIEKIQ